MEKKIEVSLEFIITMIEDTCQEFVVGNTIECDQCKYHDECKEIQRIWNEGEI